MNKAAIDVAQALARLSELTIFELRGEWRRLHRMPPPMRFSRDLLTRGISYKLQERAYGGLSTATARKLERASADPLGRGAVKPAPPISLTKEALIESVYKEVYLSRWKTEWETILRDPAKPLETRLVEFYESYLQAIFRYDWVRIFVFAGLKGVGISQRYLDLIQKKVVEPLAIELRRFAGLTVDAKVALSTAELEIAWSLHGEFFYLAIRRWVYDMKTPDDLGPVIRASVVSFLEGAPAALRNLKTADSTGEALPKRAPSASRGRSRTGRSG